MSVENHFAPDRPPREACDVRAHYNLNTGGYTIDRWKTTSSPTCSGKPAVTGAPRWLCDRNDLEGLLLRNAYFRFVRSDVEKYKSTLRDAVKAEARGVPGDPDYLPPVPGRLGQRNVHAWVLGCPVDDEPGWQDSDWRPARYSHTPPCFLDIATGNCLPTDGSIDVYLGSEPNRRKPHETDGRPERIYASSGRKPPEKKPAMFWRPQRPAERLENPVSRALPEEWHDLFLVKADLYTPRGVLQLTKIGKGAFSTVYRESGGDERVFAFTDPDSNDKSVMVDAHRAAPENPHLPAVEHFGTLRDGRNVFVMPHYRTPFRMSDATPESQKAYRALTECVKQSYPAFASLQGPIDCMLELKFLSPQIVEAVEEIYNNAINYDGDTWKIEMSPRNTATDAAGNLVLLDLLFDYKLLDRRRRAEAEKKRAAGGYRMWNPAPLAPLWSDLSMDWTANVLRTSHGPEKLVPLGRGAYSRVFALADDPASVVVIQSPGARDKRVLAMALASAPENPHLPQVSWLGSLDGDSWPGIGYPPGSPPCDVVLMPRYRVLGVDIQRKDLSPEVRKDLEDAQACLDYSHERGETMSGPAKCLERRGARPELIRAMAAIERAARDVGGDTFFVTELPDRNIAVSPGGNIVLLDPIFDENVD